MLLGIGIFANAQQKSKNTKPVIEDGADQMPVLVISTKKAKKKPTSSSTPKKDSIVISTKPKTAQPVKLIKKQ